jgi:heptosyltransferase-2
MDISSALIPFRRILIIKPGAVGDLLQMTPVVRALKRSAPDAAITMLVGLPSSADLFRFHPAVSDVIVFDRHGEHRSFRSRWAFLRRLRRRGFDLVLNFQRSNLMTWFFIAAARPARVLVYHKTRNRSVHAVVNYLGTLSPLGIAAHDLSLELVTGDDAERFADDLFTRLHLHDVPVVALNPGATHAVNRWPAQHFAALADLLSEQLSAACVIVGGPDDVALAQEIASFSRSQPRSLAGTTSLLRLGAVLRRCAAVVSGDTGPMHMATAVGTPVIALFGAADPKRTGPVGSIHRVVQTEDLSCVPCRSRSCTHAIQMECMQRIAPERVLEAVRNVLAARQHEAPPV